MKILYIDDEPMNLQLFEINFSRKNYEVLTADDGFSALEVLEKNPDILTIISDMKMPRMNGVEFIEKAKKRYPDKKYYILTGFDLTNEIQIALETGLIINYFKKPLNVKEIDAAISKTLN